MYTIENYLKICDDVYYPKVEFYYPEKKVNSPDNIPDSNGFYKNSLLKRAPDNKGWKREFYNDPDPDGFYAAYYIYNSNEQEGIIAFRGSDDIYDFCYHDFKIAMGINPQAYLKAMQFLDDVKEKYSPTFLAFTGHSLGGALAQLVGIDHNKSKVNNVSPVVCFNAPQVGYLEEYSHDEPTSREIDKIFNNIKTSLNKKISISPIGIPLVNNIANNLNWYQTLTNEMPNVLVNGAKVYNHMISYKDLNLTPDYNQPAFNAVYDILTKDYKTNINNKSYFNQLNFKEKFHYGKIKYKYIFNINSHFDLVHTVGLSLGNEIAIDIDKALINNAKKQKEIDLIKASRLRCELRALLTLHKNYFTKENIIFKANVIQDIINGSYHLKRKLSCSLDIKNYIDHIDTDLLGIVMAGKNFLFYKHCAADDLIYMAAQQHSIKSLGHAILANFKLKQIEIGKNNIQSVNLFHSFNAVYPKINYQKNFHNIMQNILYKLEEARSVRWDCRGV